VRPPAVPDLRLGHLADLDPDELHAGADVESVACTGLARTRLDLGDALLTGSRFSGLSAEETVLAGARLTEVDLDEVGLTVVRAAGSRWREVRLSGRVGVLDAPGAQWWSVHLSGCRLGYLDLRDAELVDVLLTDCVVDELVLSGAVARRVALTGTRVGILRTEASSLTDVDLRGAALRAVDGVPGLRGATISAAQLEVLAPLLAEGLGLRVEP
jgi:uncharacterized protein YjbI with pentapeptide repeats